MPDAPAIAVTIEERVATLTINHPPANVLSTPVMTELNAALDRLAAEPAVKAIVIAGTGTFFIAGADVKEIAQLTGAADGERATRLGQGVFEKIAAMPVPVIAAITGHCLGGGTELALACHLRIAGERVRIAQPEINLGIIPGFGGTQRLPRLIGTARALEICLTGDMITGAAAQQIGLVNRAVRDGEVLRQAQGLAKKIASKGRAAITAILRAVRDGATMPLADGLALESRLFGTVCETQDMQEGVRAFLEKRQPTFQDR
ncbi:MAG: enoyl-CoA hydratase/isomerase family protein [Candidatus Omnitrophica bacterium]|nr:enoyl-CoA hydratase/isomerase family protein [Candidatus Omnitrophota bacterium]